jgi:hypothetical protein
MNVQFYVPGDLDGTELEAVLRSSLRTQIFKPFDPVLVNFVTDFARSILLDKNARNHPELIVMANFFKSANILRLKEDLESAGVRTARGIVFHMAPSNVDSVFLYSSLLSLLCGNVNIIRISGNTGDQVRFVIEKLKSLLAGDHAALATRLFLVTYEHDDVITSLISEYCHMRVVWGGDATVRKIRSIALRPTASELCFPDRFSAAILDANAIRNLDPPVLSDLCSKFFNDSIWFAQQACSSPRLVSWIGKSDDCAEARHLFWDSFNAQLSQKVYENSGGMAMDRFVAACMVATDPLHVETTATSFPTRILLGSEPVITVKPYHCGNGLFYEQYFETVPQFLETLSDREQTLSVFGVDLVEILKCVQMLPMRSVDRVTKVGNALDFSHIWDGQNLLHSFTRQISIQL